MLQSGEGKVSALPLAGQCHTRDRVGVLHEDRRSWVEGIYSLCVHMMESIFLIFIQWNNK